MSPAKDVVAAGAVVFRPGREVLLVHRQRYDDWSFPKGKPDSGEHVLTAAVREVEEETGLRVRLGRPLTSQRYPVGPRMKSVHYWAARAVDSDDVEGYVPNDEIDAACWVPVDEAAGLLTYEHDRDLLDEAVAARKRTQPLVVLRHGHARSRSTWHLDDRFRPSVAAGRRQAALTVPLLAAYDVRRVVTSSSVRCVQSVQPYADATRRRVRLEERLTEEGATPESVAKVVGKLVDRLTDLDQGGVLCTHRPVLPLVFDALGVEDPGLEKGEMLVVHLRKGRPVAMERHAP